MEEMLPVVQPMTPPPAVLAGPAIKLLSVKQCADKLGVKAWQIRRLFQRHLVTPAPRVGGHRVIPENCLAVIAAALVRGGYVPAQLPLAGVTLP